MFQDRVDAAGRLALELARFRGRKDAVVIAVPRGGLPIGAVLARELGLPLDVVLTKKIGHPGNQEVAIGAVSLTGMTVDEETVSRDRISADYIAQETSRIRDALKKRYKQYHGTAEPASVAGKTVILVDDGAATGATLLVAADLLRRQGASEVVVAVPVASQEAFRALRFKADEVVCLRVPAVFTAIGEFYRDFSQVEDAEAVALLRAGAARSGD